MGQSLLQTTLSPGCPTWVWLCCLHALRSCIWPKGSSTHEIPHANLTILSRWGRHLSASWMVKLTLSPPGSALVSPEAVWAHQCLHLILAPGHPWLMDSNYPWFPSWLPYYREAHWASWAPGKAQWSSHLWEMGRISDLEVLCAHAFQRSCPWNMASERMNSAGPIGSLPFFFHRMHQALSTMCNTWDRWAFSLSLEDLITCSLFFFSLIFPLWR